MIPVNFDKFYGSGQMWCTMQVQNLECEIVEIFFASCTCIVLVLHTVRPWEQKCLSPEDENTRSQRSQEHEGHIQRRKFTSEHYQPSSVVPLYESQLCN